MPGPTETSDRAAILPRVPAEERIIRIRPTTVLAVLGLAFGFLLLLYITWISRQVLTWIIVAIFLTLALNPAVEAFERRGLRRAVSRPRSPRCSRSA